jgi:hypothetical protein
VIVTMWLFNSVKGIPRFCDTCSAAMNCPWFLNPSDALSSVIVLPVSGSIGNIPVSFVLNFGLDAIFSAIGFIGAVDGVVVVEEVVVVEWVDDLAALVVDFEAAVVVLAAPVVDLTGFALDVGFTDGAFAGLPAVVGLLAGRDVFATLAPAVVGLPAAGLTLVGFPALAGLCDGLLDAPASAAAGENVKHVAATKPMTVAENRIRVPPPHCERKVSATPAVYFLGGNQALPGGAVTNSVSLLQGRDCGVGLATIFADERGAANCLLTSVLWKARLRFRERLKGVRVSFAIGFTLARTQSSPASRPLLREIFISATL